MCKCDAGQEDAHQVDEDTHVLFGQPVEEIGRVTGQDLIVVQRGDGLDALLQLLQTRLDALHLRTHTHTLIRSNTHHSGELLTEEKCVALTCPASR